MYKTALSKREKEFHRVRGGFEYLQGVVGGDEEGTHCLGVSMGKPVPGRMPSR
jgi:hypothetical protein